MDTESAITLGTAVLGVLLGAGSLGWQAATYVLTGGRVKVDLKVGALSNAGNGLAALPADKATPDSLRQVASQGFTRPVIAVEVRNVGRMPVTVSKWSLRSSLGMDYTPFGESIGPDLPHRLDTGESETWMADLSAAIALRDSTEEAIGKGRKQAHITGVVHLADGRTYTSRERFR